MKSKNYWRYLAIIILIFSSVLLSACGNNSSNTKKNAATETESQKFISFVAADKTNWDLEVAFGDYKYTMAINLEEDNTLKLIGTCVGRNESQGAGQAGGMGGGMGGFGEPGAAEEEPTATVTQAPPLSEEDMAAKGFEINGTWTYEDGWGYTLVFNDGNNTTITANYDKASSRQYFYYELAPTVDGQQQAAVQVQFQAEDRKFRSEMASDYVIAEERNAEYIFIGSGKSGMGNAIKATLYCEKDGTVSVVSLNGSSTTFSRGTWTKDETTAKLVVKTGDLESFADYCDISGKEGYRLKYVSSGGVGGSTTITCYAAAADGVNTSDYVAADFEGTTVHTLTCVEGDYTIELTEKGFLNVYSKGTLFESSTYSYDATTDIYTLTLSGVPYTTTKTDAVYSLTGTLTQEAVNPFTPAVSDTRTFTFQ